VDTAAAVAVDAESAGKRLSGEYLLTH